MVQNGSKCLDQRWQCPYLGYFGVILEQWQEVETRHTSLQVNVLVYIHVKFNIQMFHSNTLSMTFLHLYQSKRRLNVAKDVCKYICNGEERFELTIEL